MSHSSKKGAMPSNISAAANLTPLVNFIAFEFGCVLAPTALPTSHDGRF
ncbi:hypothetical protein [Campylobacter rectus]|nr:hypothetical protein [Campylobacter rectus]